MASEGRVYDLLLVSIAFAIPLVAWMLVKDRTGLWAALFFLMVLFFLLWSFATLRNWTVPATLPVIRASSMSDIFLGLLLTVAAIAVSWAAGLAIGRAFTDLFGIVSALCIFGILMLAVSASREWK